MLLKRVAIVGNREGVVREVLKHDTIRTLKIFAVDDDETLSSSSFDEPRIDVGRVDSLLQTTNPMRKDPTTSNITTFHDNLFDVMIVQTLPKEFFLSTDASFFRASYDALSNNGVLVLPPGAVLNDDGKTKSKNR